MGVQTTYRRDEERVFASIPLHGSVLDLGGHPNSPYRNLFKGSFSITAADAPGSRADIRCDFEQPLPIENEIYDAVLCINVLEHIFEYRQLLAEVFRILKPGGALVIASPFLIPYHPFPHDFHRYTGAALERALQLAGFTDVQLPR